LGHSFFKIETQGKIIAIDPFHEENIGTKPARFKADVLLSSHDHVGHNNMDVILGDPFVLKTPGEIEINGIFIKGVETYHDNTNGEKFGKNTIYVIDSENIRLVHLGNFGEKKIKDELLEKLGNVDILLIPISGKYLNQPVEDAIGIIKQIEPKIIIPMHYGNKQEKDGLEKFVKEIGITPEKLDKLSIKRNNISDDEDAQTQLIVLQN
jgi:L-ascorbate metabolism protein UlaG (beta-lactamase superfamily)